MTESDRCEATVWKRDTYRRTGGKAHFKMHYTEQRCSRRAVGDGLCCQHMQKVNVSRWRFIR